MLRCSGHAHFTAYADLKTDVHPLIWPTHHRSKFCTLCARTLDVHSISAYIPSRPGSLRAASGVVWLAEQGWRRLQAGPETPAQEAQSLPDPDEGSALDGWMGLDERRRQCRPDNVSGNSLRSRPGSAVAA